MNKAHLEKKKEGADTMAALDGKTYVVVDLGGCYQIWPAMGNDKKSREHIYITGEVIPVDDWDDLLS